ncbi:MAG: hypothetical protein IT457_01065 [Planctomycetes bacterium]|nr:hypothetical protein [Planctomycetota bacterium]
MRRPLDTIALFIGVAAVYLAAGQHTIYKLDGWHLLRRLSGEDSRSDMHLAFTWVTNAMVEALQGLGLTLHSAAVASCALATAAGVALVHVAARRLGASRGPACALALAVAASPAVAFFATVLERHGIFFAGTGLAAFAAARFATRPNWAGSLALAVAIVVAYALHSTGALLGASYLPLAVVQARAGDGAGPRAWRPLLVQGIACGALAASLALLARRLALLAGLVGDEGASLRFLTVLAGSYVQHPEQLPGAIWNELVFPFVPFSLLWLVAFVRPALVREARAVLVGSLAYLALAFLLLGDTDERGAYTLPLAWPYVWLTWRALGTRVLLVAILLAAAVAGWRIRAHDTDPLAPVASGLRELAGPSPFLLAAASTDFELLYLHFPTARPNVDFWDAFDAKAFPVAVLRDNAAVLRGYLDAQQARGVALVLTDAGRAELAMPVEDGRAGPLVLSLLEDWYRFEPLQHGAFRGYRLSPRS